MADWATYNRTLEGNRGSPLAEIDAGNVARLRPVCTFDLGERAAFQTGPVVVAGTMYLTTAGGRGGEGRDLSRGARGLGRAGLHRQRGRRQLRRHRADDGVRRGHRGPGLELRPGPGRRARGPHLAARHRDGPARRRPGANLHTYSVVERGARLGTLKRSRQLLQGDDHDWDVAAAPSLVTTARGRRLIALGGKDGHLYAIDRESGDLRWRARVTTVENVDAPLTAEGTRFCPGVNGGIEWNGPSYSRALDAFFVNAIDWCTTVKLGPASRLQGKNALPWTGSSELRHPFGVQDSVSAGWLTAVDAESGAVRWRYHSPTPLVAGVTSTAGGLVFTGDLRGEVLAFDGRAGTIRWRFATGQPIGGGVVTYRTGGRQYVAAAAGMHSPATWKLESPPAKVVVFALP